MIVNEVALLTKNPTMRHRTVGVISLIGKLRLPACRPEPGLTGTRGCLVQAYAVNRAVNSVKNDTGFYEWQKRDDGRLRTNSGRRLATTLCPLMTTADVEKTGPRWESYARSF